MDTTNVVSRNIDVVFCIDITGSMGLFLDNFRDSLDQIVEGIQDIAEDKGFDLERLRFKFIFFKDFNYDAEPLKMTKFFRMPDRYEEVKEILARYEADGGGDMPESGMEALYYAFTSNWTDGPKDRQITMLFTDADAQFDYDWYDQKEHDIDIKVREIADLEKVYNQGSEEAPAIKDKIKRLVIFAPEETTYQELPFDNFTFVPVEYGCGVTGVSLDVILQYLKEAIC